MFKKGDKVLVEAVVAIPEDEEGDVEVHVNERYASDYLSVCVDKDIIHPARVQWIDVNERLPEIDPGSFYSTVIVTTKGGLCFPLVFNGNKFIEPQMGGEICDVIAWQPIPEPYEPPVKLLISCTECEYYEEIQIGTRNGCWFDDYCSRHKQAGSGFVNPQKINGVACHVADPVDVNNDR